MNVRIFVRGIEATESTNAKAMWKIDNKKVKELSLGKEFFYTTINAPSSIDTLGATIMACFQALMDVTEDPIKTSIDLYTDSEELISMLRTRLGKNATYFYDQLNRLDEVLGSFKEFQVLPVGTEEIKEVVCIKTSTMRDAAMDDLHEALMDDFDGTWDDEDMCAPETCGGCDKAC